MKLFVIILLTISIFSDLSSALATNELGNSCQNSSQSEHVERHDASSKKGNAKSEHDCHVGHSHIAIHAQIPNYFSLINYSSKNTVFPSHKLSKPQSFLDRLTRPPIV